MNNDSSVNRLTILTELLEKYPGNEAIIREIDEIEYATTGRIHDDIQEFATKVITNEHEHRRQYRSFLTSTGKNFLIYGPTQLGKTDATLTFVKTSLDHDTITIVTNDNKTDQQEQMYNRFKIALSTSNCEALLKVSDKKFSSKFSEVIKDSTKIVIFCLDNTSQIKKLTQVLHNNLENLSTKIAILHDEGDALTKHSDVNNIQQDQCDSHKKWIEMSKFCTRQNIDLKRVFVTATPENIVTKYPIERIIELEETQNYIGYKNIHYCKIDNSEESVNNALNLEISRRLARLENGIILVCTEKKIGAGQDPSFYRYCDNHPAAVINTYNGTGITVRPVYYDKFSNLFNKFVRRYNNDKNNKKITFENDNNIYIIKHFFYIIYIFNKFIQ